MALAILDYAAWNDTDGKDENYIVLDEVFTSVYDTFVNLNHSYIGGEVVTTTDGLTTFTNGTDYEMDYTNGQIKVLSTGSMADNTNYHIDYNFDETRQYDDTQGAETFFNDFVATNFTAWNGKGEYTSPIFNVNKTARYSRIYHSFTAQNASYDVQVSVNGGDFVSKSNGASIASGEINTLQYKIVVTATDQQSATQPQIDGQVQLWIQEDLDITADGSVETPPKITITFQKSANYVELKRDSGEAAMRFEHSFAANDVLEIDFKKKTATLNGANALKYQTAYNFFNFEPGITHEPWIESDGNIIADISYNPRWL